jgi:hypothetical protein
MDMKMMGIGTKHRLIGRFLIFVWGALLLGAAGARAETIPNPPPTPAGPVKTVVQDTLYRADGSVAHGRLTIRWNEFSTSAGIAVAAGELTAATDVNGVISIPLIPNTGSTPAGTYYKVVMKLEDGTTSEEQWVVPATGTTTVAAIRAQIVPQAVAAQFVSTATMEQQFANLATVASTGSYNDLLNKPTLTADLTAPGAIGSETPGPVNATGYSVNGLPFSSANLSDASALVRTSAANTFTQSQTVGGATPTTISPTAGVTSPTLDGVVIASSTHPTIDITHPAYGAACNGNTDDTAALQAAISAAGVSGGTILIPGIGTGCYIANPTSLVWPTLKGALALNLQGKLLTGSTLVLPNFVDVIGQGGGMATQFGNNGPISTIQGPTGSATLGTACTAGTACTFTPSSMNGIATSGAISIAGQTNCTIIGVSRSSNYVTATFSGACHIAPGFNTTIAGVTDTSYDGSFEVSQSDYVQNTLGWKQTGTTSTSSGGTATGYSEDSIETAVIAATTSTTATATFQNAHSAADMFGIVGVLLYGNSGGQLLQHLTVSSSGNAIEAMGSASEPTAMVHLDDVSAISQSPWGGALEFNQSFWNFISHSSFLNVGGQSAWGIRFTNSKPSAGTASGGFAYISDSVVNGGIKFDHGPGNIGSIALHNVVVEQTMRGAVTIDPTGSSIALVSMDNTGEQDTFNGAQECLLYSLYPATTGALSTSGTSTTSFPCLANIYFHGSIDPRGVLGPVDFNGAEWGGISNDFHGVSLTQNRITETELRGIGANLSPSLIPYATLPVAQPTSWSGNTGCSLTSGVSAPDMTNGAVTLTATGGASNTTQYSYTTTEGVGDVVLFGGWVSGVGTGLYQGTGSAITLGGGGAGSFFFGDGLSGSSATFAPEGAGFSMLLNNDWWHPVVGVARIATVAGGSHAIQMNAGCSTAGISYYAPFMIYIPASAGIPQREIARWRQQLLHGIVPPGMPASVLAINPSLKMYWGGDTDLYRGSAGLLQTDGAFNAANGYQVGGSAFSSGNLADWTNSGVQNGYVPTWNSTTNKWTPGAQSGAGVTQIVAGTNMTVSTAGGTGAVTVNVNGSSFCQVGGGTNCTFTAAPITPNGSTTAPGIQIGSTSGTGIAAYAGNQIDVVLNGVLGTQIGPNYIGLNNGSYATKWQNSSLTANQTFTTPNAASNSVQPQSSATSNQWVQYVDSGGVQHLSQPAFSNISGSPSTTQVPVQSLTTTGTSGAATLSGGVLNIPQYSGSSTSSFPQQTCAQSWTGQSASLSPAMTCAIGISGQYCVNETWYTQSVGTAGTFSSTYSYNNGYGGVTGGSITTISVTSLTPSGTANYPSCFWAASGTTVSIGTTLSGVSGSFTYGGAVTVTRLQ